MARFLLFSTLLLLAACSENPIMQLPYAPTAAVAQGGGANVSVGAVTDGRGQADPAEFGLIRSLYGIPYRTIRGERPVAELVRQALTDALAARGMLAPAGRGTREVRVTVAKLEVDRVIRLEAKADLRLAVFDASGQNIYRDEVQLDRTTGGYLSAGPAELRDLLAKTLSEALDQLLDKPGFRQAVQAVQAGRRTS